jgi:hypothetical protein
MASNTLSRRYELMARQTVVVTEFRELFDCPSYINQQQLEASYCILEFCVNLFNKL